jgi:hypothetical protein
LVILFVFIFDLLESAAQSGTDEGKRLEWLENLSFLPGGIDSKGQKSEIVISSDEDAEKSIQIIEPIKVIEISSDDKTIEIASDDDDDDDKAHKKKKKKKKELKKQRRKKKKKARSDSNDGVQIIQSTISYEDSRLFDAEYKQIFSQIPKDKLGRAVFLEDIPSLSFKYAYRIDKRADLNNLCFDTLYHKHVSSYKQPPLPGAEPSDAVKKKRKEFLRELKKSRYFNQMRTQTDNNNSETTEKFLQSDLKTNASESLILFKNLVDPDRTDAFSNKTAVLNKSLNENPKDVDKWLELIGYQSDLKDNLNQSSSFDRTLSIYERAVKENPSSFKLKFELLKFKSKYDDAAMTGSEQMKTTNEQATENEFQNLINEQLEVFNKQPKLNDVANCVRSLILLWSEYIKYFQYKNTTNKNLTRIKSIFKKSFDFFLVQLRVDDSKIKFTVFHFVLDFLLGNYLMLLQYADYSEKVIGIYQALIDFNLSSNSNTRFLIKNEGDANSLFELFCDSCLPKYGERFYSGYLNGLEKRKELYDLLETNITVRESCDSAETVILNEDDKRIELKWLVLQEKTSKIHIQQGLC